jgi:Asp-tRNA(Asn)/Glu-tRNA(Gln) amidotransferase C subunit
MDRGEALEKIVGYISQLNKIKTASVDSLKNYDVVAAVDCIHKYYTAVGAVSVSIIMFKGVLSDDEIVKYHQTLNSITQEFREETVALAKKVKGFPE